MIGVEKLSGPVCAPIFFTLCVELLNCGGAVCFAAYI